MLVTGGFDEQRPRPFLCDVASASCLLRTQRAVNWPGSRVHVYFFHPLILVADYGFAELKEISVYRNRDSANDGCFVYTKPLCIYLHVMR